LRECELFRGISDGEVGAALECLRASRAVFEKGAFIFRAGENADRLGAVLSGGAYVAREDFWGGRSILARVGPGELFGEAFICAGVENYPVSAVAAENSEILFLDYAGAVAERASPQPFHAPLLRNMLKILAEKNIFLTRKMEHITRKTTREKLVSYLSERALAEGAHSFDIPFNRQELADYLSVERSAMSAELSRMKGEGILDFKKNHFTLLRVDDGVN
jgi:CRP-like cAMP-binding protein